MKGVVNGLENDPRMTCSEGEREAETYKTDRLSQFYEMGRTCCATRRNCLSRISGDLREIEILEDALSFLGTLFSLFEKDTPGSLAGLLREVLREDGFDRKHTVVKRTFGRSRYVLGGLLPSLDGYDERGCFAQDQELWPRKEQRVFGINELGSSHYSRNSLVHVEGGSVVKKLGDERFAIVPRASKRKRREKINLLLFSSWSAVDYLGKRKGYWGCIGLSWSTDDDIDHTFEKHVLVLGAFKDRRERLGVEK